MGPSVAANLLLFDIDGTLIHAAGAGRTALVEALTTEFGVPEPVFDVGLAGRTDRAIMSEALTNNGVELHPENFARYRRAYFRRLPTVLGESDGRVLPGVVDLLGALDERTDHRLGILTGNAEDSAWIKLRHFGLAEFFFGGAFGDHHHDRDDVARNAHQEWAGRLDEGGEIWIVGDTPADVQCARSIQARVIAVSTGFADRAALEKARPDFLLEDLCDIDHFLALLEGERPIPARRS